MKNSKHYFGWVSEEEKPEGIEMFFLMHEYEAILSWLIGFYEGIYSIAPTELFERAKQHAINALKHFEKMFPL